MKEEISRILKMVEDGKIGSDKAAELIDALKEKEQPMLPKVVSQEYLDKMLKIRVIDKEDKVNVNVPIKFIKAVGGAITKIPGVNENLQGVDMKMIMDAIDEGLDGKIVDIQSADGSIVEIFIE